MSGSQEPRDDGRSETVDPEEFLRALMHISKDDAERARENSPATRPKPRKDPETTER